MERLVPKSYIGECVSHIRRRIVIFPSTFILFEEIQSCYRTQYNDFLCLFVSASRHGETMAESQQFMSLHVIICVPKNPSTEIEIEAAHVCVFFHIFLLFVHLFMLFRYFFSSFFSFH